MTPDGVIQQVQPALYIPKCLDCGKQVDEWLGGYQTQERALQALEEHLCIPRRLRAVEERLDALEGKS